MTGREASVRLPFLNGVYVAVDAVEGAFVIVDGPYCVATKAEMQHCHNLRSGLLPALGRSRVVQTGMFPGMEEVSGLALDRRRAVEEVFREVCAWPEARLVLATSFDFHALVNLPLAEIGAAASRESGKPVLPIPSRSLEGEWLEGYALACDALARGIVLEAGPLDPDLVAIVGHLMDRTEPDQRANVAELQRLVGLLGLRAAPVWLSGCGPEDLAGAGRAGTILSLPYAREAARTLGRRTGAPVVEARLPLGLSRTADLLAALGGSTGRADRALEAAERETAAAIRDTERHVNRFLLGRRARTRLLDPVLEEALASFLEDVGAVHSGRAGWDGPGEGDPDGAPALVFTATLKAEPWAGGIPFGYPNYLDHPLTDRPFLGFAGHRVLVERMSEAVLRQEASPA